MTKAEEVRRRVVGRTAHQPAIGLGDAGLVGVFNLLVADPDDVPVTVTIIVPSPPVTWVLGRLAPGTRIEVVGCGAPTPGLADVRALRAERITVLFASVAA